MGFVSRTLSKWESGVEDGLYGTWKDVRSVSRYDDLIKISPTESDIQGHNKSQLDDLCVVQFIEIIYSCRARPQIIRIPDTGFFFLSWNWMSIVTLLKYVVKLTRRDGAEIMKMTACRRPRYMIMIYFLTRFYATRPWRVLIQSISYRRVTVCFFSLRFLRRRISWQDLCQRMTRENFCTKRIRGDPITGGDDCKWKIIIPEISIDSISNFRKWKWSIWFLEAFWNASRSTSRLFC